jgi:hypothetical protein
MVDQLEAATAALVIQPGDRVLVAVSQDLTREAAHHLTEQLTERFPGAEFTVVQADQLAVMPEARPADVKAPARRRTRARYCREHDRFDCQLVHGRDDV